MASRALAGKQRLDQLEIPNGRGVQHHVSRALIESRTVQMTECRFLGIAQVVQYGARPPLPRAACRPGRSHQAKAAENAPGSDARHSRRRRPSGSSGVSQARRARDLATLGVQHFAYVQRFERGSNSAFVQFRRTKFARREIGIGQPAAFPLRENGRQVVVFMRAEQIRIGRGARRDDARDFAPDQFFARTRFLHLFADGDAIAALIRRAM